MISVRLPGVAFALDRNLTHKQRFHPHTAQLINPIKWHDPEAHHTAAAVLPAGQSVPGGVRGMSEWDQLLQESEDLAFKVRRQAVVMDTPMHVAPHWHVVAAQSYSTTEWTSVCVQDAEGFPQVDRDLLQVEELSQKLRTKASRLDQAEDGLAASRLLSQQGINVHRRGFIELERSAHTSSKAGYCRDGAPPCCMCALQVNRMPSWTDRIKLVIRLLLLVLRYNRDLLELELRPTHEDVFQSQPSNMDDYLQQVHESTVVTAIQVQLAIAPSQVTAPFSARGLADVCSGTPW